MSNHICELCLKEFSHKSLLEKHKNKKRSCKYNNIIEEVDKNLIINKKLKINNSGNIITNKMQSTEEIKKAPKLTKIEKKEKQEQLLIEIDKHTLEDYKNDNLVKVFTNELDVIIEQLI